jgi:phosphoribosylformylglycinamidine synthase
MMQLKESIRALGDACKQFETPVTGGNVSLYNQTGEQSIKPTPTIGMIGLVDDVAQTTPSQFKKTGEILVLVGNISDTNLYQSEYARTVLGKEDLKCPPIDLREEVVLQRALLQMNSERVISTAHDLSEGGLFQTVIEMCTPELGFSLKTPENHPPIPIWFGEYGGRVAISLPESQISRVEIILKNHAVPYTQIGKVVEGECRIDSLIKLPVNETVALRKKLWEKM